MKITDEGLIAVDKSDLTEEQQDMTEKLTDLFQSLFLKFPVCVPIAFGTAWARVSTMAIISSVVHNPDKTIEEVTESNSISLRAFPDSVIALIISELERFTTDHPNEIERLRGLVDPKEINKRQNMTLEEIMNRVRNA